MITQSALPDDVCTVQWRRPDWPRLYRNNFNLCICQLSFVANAVTELLVNSERDVTPHGTPRRAYRIRRDTLETPSRQCAIGSGTFRRRRDTPTDRPPPSSSNGRGSQRRSSARRARAGTGSRSPFCCAPAQSVCGVSAARRPSQPDATYGVHCCRDARATVRQPPTGCDLLRRRSTARASNATTTALLSRLYRCLQEDGCSADVRKTAYWGVRVFSVDAVNCLAVAPTTRTTRRPPRRGDKRRFLTWRLRRTLLARVTG